MKILIAGCGMVGTVLAEKLTKENHNVVVIDNNSEHIEYINNTLDVMAINGDASFPGVLRGADVASCDLLIAVTESDEKNMLICLLAKKMGVTSTIARVRTYEHNETIRIIKDEMGISMGINPEQDAANEIFRSLTFRSAGQIETFGKGRIELMTCPVKPNSPICDVKIKELSKTLGVNVLICAIKRDQKVYIPNGDWDIRANDIISFVSSHQDAINFFKKMNYDSSRIRNMTIIGGSKLAIYLAIRCIADGIQVKIIDKNRETCKKLTTLIPNAEIICGDGTDTALLEEENIINSDAIVTATEEDATNTLISMYAANNFKNCKVITKIKKSDFEDMLYNLNIGNVYNPKYITTDHILKYVRAMQNTLEDDIESLVHIIDNKVGVFEFKIREGLPNLGIALKDLKLKKDILLTTITRGTVYFIPHGQDTIEPGDTVLAVTTNQEITRFADIFA